MKKILLFTTLLINSVLFSQTWVTQNTGFTSPSRGIIDINIVDANTVWAQAFDGTNTDNNIQEFTRTTDSGVNWTPGIINVGNTILRISNISPVSGTTAWAGAFNNASGLGGVWKTTDGGVNWVQQNATAYTTADKSWFNLVHFFDANNGVTVGDPAPGTDFEIYYTSNAGTTWTAVNPLTLPNALTEEYGYNGGFAVAGNSMWFVTNKGRIYKSVNMGVNWTVTQSPITDFGSATISGKLYFSDNNNGFLLSSATTNNFYTTTNGGTTWNTPTTFSGVHKLLSYVPNTNVVVATSGTLGSSGSSYSLNNGSSFTNIDAGTTTQRLTNKFIDGSTGWAGGFNTNAFLGGIFKFSGTLGVTDFEKTIVSASPNPTSGIITLTGADISDVVIFDLLGKQVLNSKFNTLSEVSLDLSNLQTGAYLLKATSANGTSTIKVMKN